MKHPTTLFINKSACAVFLLCAVSFGAFARGGGGCFLRDTPIAMADGTSKPIGSVKAGDLLLTCALDGSVAKSRVQDIYSLEVDGYLEVTVGSIILKVTPEHPFFVGDGAFRTALSLSPGDTVYAFDGRALRPQSIASIRRVDSRAMVFNLSAESPNTFLANGFLVHNKGGGCFLGNTPILMADGSAKEIQSVRIGDTLLTSSPDGTAVPSRVREIFNLDVHEYLEVDIGGIVLRVTAEHPFFVGDGQFKTIGSLKPGDAVYTFDGLALSLRRIASIKPVTAKAIVFNLSADNPNTFVAGGMLVHNKGGGCFLGNTPVAMADGSAKNIGEIKIGDMVRTCAVDGKTVTARVSDIISLDADGYLEVVIDGVILRVTREHPFYVGNGEFRNIGTLSEGDFVYAFDGKALAKKRIASMKSVLNPVRVYNLSVDGPNTFVAGGMLVHNKGGGFHGGGFHGGGYHGSRSGSRSSYSAGDEWGFFAFVILFFGICLIVKIIEYRESHPINVTPSSSSDKIYGSSAIAKRAALAKEYIDKIVVEDSSFTEESLKKVARHAFMTLQEAWEKRNYRLMDGLTTKALQTRHVAQLDGLRRDHEINKIDRIKINRIEIVNVCYSPARKVREFSAIIDATALDYYIDDRSHSFIRGDLSPSRFQEMYVFREGFGEPWLLAVIEQAKETKRMRAKNVYDPGKSAGQGDAEAKPSLPVVSGLTRMERELDRLARRDVLWNRDALVERVSLLFTQVYMHREGGDAIPPGSCSPEIAKMFVAEDLSRAAEDISVEYRNFCVRSCFVTSFKNGSVPEFTARITAHAQRKITRRGDVILQDNDLREFTEYWTFTRSGGDWLLSKIGVSWFARIGS
jgi:predicted lipid-binding transport protein (Tim44 family)